MRPSIGRVVHYVSHGSPVQPDGSQAYTSECRAAIVTEVGPQHASSHLGGIEPELSLCVLNPTGQFFSQNIRPDQGTEDAQSLTHLCNARNYRGGTWHWPARVD